MSKVSNGPVPEMNATKEKEAKGAPAVTNETVRPEARKKKLVRRHKGPSALKHYLWVAGHSMTVAFGSLSLLFQILRFPNYYYIRSISYRLTFIGAIIALTATFSHRFGLRYLPPASSLIAYQNLQFMILAVIWMFTFKSIFKLIPYVLISLLQLSSHKQVNAVLKESESLAAIIAYDELVLIVCLFLRTICFRNTSGFQLAVFLTFYWMRILYNKETGNLFRAIIERLDGKMSEIKNEKVQHYWPKYKQFLDERQQDKA